MTQTAPTSVATTSEQQALQGRASVTALAAGLAALTMLFSAFISAYVVRRGVSSDWSPIPFPFMPASLSVVPLLFVVSALWRKWPEAALLSAVAFAATHVWIWMQIQHPGITLSTGPAAAFFLILITAYQCCILPGFVMLITAMNSKQSDRLRGASYYWNYLALLWLLLLTLFYYWP